MKANPSQPDGPLKGAGGYPEYGYILDFGNLGTNVANGPVRILTLDITSRIYIYISAGPL